jgi:histidinol dehydrogenase
MLLELRFTDQNFDIALSKLLDRNIDADGVIERRVREIIETVRKRGDQALIDYSRRFDRLDVDLPRDLTWET